MENAIEGSIFENPSMDRSVNHFEDYMYELTPVQKVGDMWFKREDWFAPLGYGGVNGSKLRQLIWLINGYYKFGQRPRGVVSGAVTGSPQHPMAAIVSKHYGLHYVSAVGTEDLTKPNLALAAKYGADFITSKVGYAKTLEAKAREFALAKDYLLIETNIVVNGKDNHTERVKDFHSVGGKQVENIPKHIETLIIPCGSGTSTISILYGLGICRSNVNYFPNLKNIILMGIGNVGSKDIGFIHRRLALMSASFYDRFNLIHYNLNGSGYCKYEDLRPACYNGIQFHPRYEGKCINYLFEYHPEHFNDNTLFWIVGSEPKF